MKKSYKWRWALGVISCLLIVVVCQKDAKQKVAEAFIKTQINCRTYTVAAGDEGKIKKKFLEFFTEESYQRYLDDVFGYMYPRLFYMFNVDKCVIHKIECKGIEKGKESNTYHFEVSYTLIELYQKGKNVVNNTKMQDTLQITVNSNNKIEKVIILNTSSIIKKLFLDIKVQ